MRQDGSSNENSSAVGSVVTQEERADVAQMSARDVFDRWQVGISFEDAFRARELMSAASRPASNGQLVLIDAVLIVKDETGRTTVTETKDPQAGNSALSGAMWAGLFGLLTPTRSSLGEVTGLGQRGTDER